ncbi:hypothetical protein D9615_010326 [Tricholomella constricta]|uniref:Rab-GAP TBC domain-containing protein n=1 Tax=Tricholomella constricta TaxID=117010 RepID=A0A8H5GP91_9AGAR|nr:hypothetical protein D9615_010326 [Tricholomella constricta]
MAVAAPLDDPAPVPFPFPFPDDDAHLERTRRPSLAPSAMSAASSSDWEGAAAADIYDDYRYSRYSVASARTTGTAASSSSARRGSASSKFSVAGAGGSGGGGGGGVSGAGSGAGTGAGEWSSVPPFVDDPEARSRADSGAGSIGMGMGMSRPSVDSVMGQTRPSVEQQQQQQQPQQRTRSRSNATAGFKPLVGLVSSPPPPPPPPPPQPLETESKRTRPVGHREMESVGGGSESDDVSVYTQSSMSMGKPSPRADADASFGAGTTTTTSSVPPSPLHHEFTRSTGAAGNGNRPAPLTFTGPHAASSQDQDQDQQQQQQQRHQQEKGKVRSPLLHTTWGSPLSSPTPHTTTHTHAHAQFASASAPLSGPRATPPSSAASNTGYTGTGEGFSGGGGGGGGMPASATYFPVLGGGGGGNGTEDGGAGGMASAMRHRIEVERKPSVAESVVEVHEQEGVGVGMGIGIGMGMERRIVVEDDEDEIVIGQDVSFGSVLGGGLREGELELGQDVDVDVDESMDSTITMGSTRLGMGMALHDAPSISSSPEPEPEMVAMGRLAPLVVANPNRTPSLSEGEEENEKDALRKDAESVTPSTPLSQAHAFPPTTTTTSSPPPPPAYSTLRPPKSSPSPAPSHLRPSLSELRGIQPGQEQGQRRSLFLPHPNAPKAPSAHSPGPMYIAQQQPPPPQPNTQQTRGGVMQTLRMALAGQGPPQGPRGRGPTIYGIMSADLSAATGPVLVHFSLTPPPATAPPPGSVPSPVLPVVPIPALSVTGPLPQIVAPVPVQAVRRVGSMASLDAAAAAVAEAEPPPSRASGGGVIPRANFFPKAGGVRPRSRSFSGFQSTTAEIRLPLQRSREEGSQPVEMPSASEMKRALSPIILSPATQLSSSPTKPSPLRISSPLSRTQENGPGSRSFKPTNSPLAQLSSSLPGQQPASAPSSPTYATVNRPVQQLRQFASRSTLNDAPAQRPIPRTRAALPGGSISDAASPPIQPSPVQVPEARARPSVDTDAMSVHSTRSNLVSPPPTLGRQNSLRSKLSLPNLRRNLGRQDESSPSVPPDSPVVDGDTLQVQDMDFELVRPNIAQFQAARGSEDSGVMGRDGSVDARQDANFLRAASPAISLVVPRSPTVVSDSSSGMWQPVRASPQPRGTESESSMDAHRQRELKWMSIMGSVSPAQSRKNKKVKKLLFDGVPSSVRYLVWSHLTDGKARCVPGVYTQLGGRGRVPALADVAKDVQRCFADHPQLQSTQGPVLSLLQAYLTMVPDVQYTTGLTLIAGQLLLLAPEEDAFWIFVSIMDTHIRPYFYSTPTQLDVDASLFSRALESIDPSLAKKMFTDFAISPSSICRPWFTSLFVGSLPPDYLNRVWDIFLFEGVPFLFRVALALVSCCRRQILDSISADSVLGALLRPAAAFLPSSPEALVTLALALKLKDDDIRKQRVKLEAQVKRQTQQAPRATPGSISLPRT